MKQKVVWPAIIKMVGIDDLLYVESQQAWDNVSQDHQYHSDDMLIDSHGHCFQLQQIAEQTVFVAMQQAIDLAQLDLWVRQHLVAMQQCCVYKVELENFEQGFRLVRETREQD
jgi:hypothetical protein